MHGRFHSAHSMFQFVARPDNSRNVLLAEFPSESTLQGMQNGCLNCAMCSAAQVPLLVATGALQLLWSQRQRGGGPSRCQTTNPWQAKIATETCIIFRAEFDIGCKRRIAACDGRYSLSSYALGASGVMENFIQPWTSGTSLLSFDHGVGTRRPILNHSMATQRTASRKKCSN
jgi:hypothetical protein